MVDNRAEQCWACKYFIQAADQGATGVCARKAPTKQDEILGPVGVYGPLSFFQSLSDGRETFCGEFAQMIGPVPEYIEPS